jgi:hypothetical protein
MMGTSVPQPQLQPDPALEAQQRQAQQANVDALKQLARTDTAALMARYGTRLALAAAGAPPGSAPAISPLSSAFGSAANPGGTAAGKAAAGGAGKG